jgi:hypothetical protein
VRFSLDKMIGERCEQTVMRLSGISDTRYMDLTANLDCDASPTELFAWVDDLGLYPQWMGLVHRAEPIDPIEDRPAWNVELRARIGPFARSKRLVMVRSVCISPSTAVFERCERDGRDHSMWRLSAAIDTLPNGSSLKMQLHYGGALWTGGIAERVLHEEINRSKARLASLLGGSTH